MSSSTATSQNAPEVPICRCGLRANLFTSWTEGNTARRFHGCVKYENKKKRGCGFFRWWDPETEERFKNIISSLLRKLNRAEDKIKTLKLALAISWIFFVLVVMFIVM